MVVSKEKELRTVIRSLFYAMRELEMLVGYDRLLALGILRAHVAFTDRVVNCQQDLDPDSKRALYENLWKLYT